MLPPVAVPEARAAVAQLSHFLATADAASPETLDVAIVGGGLSAIAAAVRLREAMPGVRTALFEARADTGGTWDLFRYPSARSDSDMHTLSFPFAPWRGPASSRGEDGGERGTRDAPPHHRRRPSPSQTSIAAAPDILAYLRRVAADTGVDGLVRPGHRVTGVDWSSADRAWTITCEVCPSIAVAEGAAAAVPGPGPEAWAGAVAAAAPPRARAPPPADPPPPTVLTFRARFINFCAGYYDYSAGHHPPLPGEEAFKGVILHPQFWPAGETLAGRRVVVVGSGATAVTLAPALAAAAASGVGGSDAAAAAPVVLLQRSPSHVVAVPSVDGVALGCVKCGLPRLARYWAYWRARLLYRFARAFPAAAAKGIRAAAQKAIGPDVPVDPAFAPTYPPWDQRLCIAADGDLFAAVKAGTVEMVTDEIQELTPTGIVLRSGRTLACDAIVTATGLKLLPLGGAAVSVDGVPVDLAAATVWRGVMLAPAAGPPVPNLFATTGYINASWTLRADLVARWIARTVSRMARKGFTTVAPRAPAPDVGRVPIVGLRSGYVTRATGMPSGGDRGPWRPPSSWAADEAVMGCCGGCASRRDGVLQFA